MHRPLPLLVLFLGLSTFTLLLPWNAFTQNSPKPPQGTVREIVITKDTTLEKDAVLNAAHRHQGQPCHHRRQRGHAGRAGQRRAT